MSRLVLFALWSLFLLTACDRGGDQPYGETCVRDGQCSSGLCVSVERDATEGRCTRSCANDGDCPRGHSCSGATNNGVVVCMPGPAVPIGGAGVEN